MNKIFPLSLVSVCLLCACSNFDMQGYDPNAYYTKHPVENTVERKETQATTHFDGRNAALSPSQQSELLSALKNISPAAVESINVTFSKQQLVDEKRKEGISRLLRANGFTQPIVFDKSDDLARNDVNISLTYASVVSPDCPDWKMSPAHTFSNKTATNYGCAQATNLGLMVADPHDLVYGAGSEVHNVAVSTKALTDYHTGAAPAAAAAAPSSAPVAASQ